MHNIICMVLFLAYLVGTVSVPKDCEAFLFHATRKAAAKRIMASGFGKARMKTSARMGKGVYAAERRATALKELPKANAVVRMREGTYLKKNTIELRRPAPDKLKQIVGERDLRGTVKRGVIGPRLGHEIGRTAGKNGKAIRYTSARDARGANIFIPKKTYAAHPRLIRPDKVGSVN